MEVNYFLDKLSQHIDLKKMNVRALARDSGVGYDVVRELVRGRTRSINVDNAKKLLDSLGLSFADIYDEKKRGFAESRGDTIKVPRYKAMLSAGHGAVNSQQEIVDYIPFTPEFFVKKLKRKSVDGLVMCDINGDSMEPTIGDGDLAMINTKFEDGASGLYAVNYGGETLVKRVERIGNGYNLISDNNFYPTIKITGADLDNFEIIGKVVWISRLL